MEHVTRARELFKSGYNCAQAVAGAFAEEMGIPFETAVKIASSFGGGMGGMRDTCGAVTAMFMVAGAVFGYGSPTDQKAKTEHYALIRGLAEKFRAEHDTCVCGQLLASLPVKLQADPLPRTEEYYRVRPCVRFVETSARLLDDLLAQKGQ